ncbi:MAG: VanZ family protein [Steroidobacteraceae bacterium]
MHPLRYRTWWIAGGILLALAIVVASLAPPADLPKVQLWDKFEHAFAFFVLAAWFGGVLRPDRYRWLALALVAFGVAIELAQGAMGLGRTAELRDVLADASGIVIGVAAARLIGADGWMRRVERFLGVAVPAAD